MSLARLSSQVLSAENELTKAESEHTVMAHENAVMATQMLSLADAGARPEGRHLGPQAAREDRRAGGRDARQPAALEDPEGHGERGDRGQRGGLGAGSPSAGDCNG